MSPSCEHHQGTWKSAEDNTGLSRIDRRSSSVNLFGSIKRNCRVGAKTGLFVLVVLKQ